MDGLEAVEIKKSSLERTIRIDAEFYKKDNLTILSELKKHELFPLTSFLKVSDGNHMTIKDDFRVEGIKYYRGQDIYNFFIEEAAPVCISEAVFNNTNMKRSHLKKRDILMSIVGAIIGNIALVSTDEKQTCSCKLAIFRPKSNVESEVVAVYLKSRYGQNQIQKFRRGAAQTGFLLEDADQVFMPVFSNDFCNIIKEKIAKIYLQTQESSKMYKEAEQILLKELGMSNFVPSAVNHSVKYISESFNSSGRLDAEYYQKKYDDLFYLLNGLPCKKLGTIAGIKKSIEPGSDSYLDNGIPFVRVADLSKFEISQPEIYLDRLLYSGFELKPKKDTILLTKDGSVCLAYKSREDMDVITSGAILHLTIKDKSINPDFLTLMLNSIVVRMQAERDAGGSIIQHWKPSEVAQVVIPCFSPNIQSIIASKTSESFTLRKESNALLEKTIKAVEIAIEEGEDKAMQFMNT